MSDDRDGKPKSAKQALAEVSETLDAKREQMTRNFLRILTRERGKAPDAFGEFCEGITMLLSELDAEMGHWAGDCVRTERAMHEASS